jgi:lipopolysaccharide transport system ATP-binding protein
MSDIVLDVQGVYKKFKRGERYNSLRDLLPALSGRMFRAEQEEPLEQREFWALKDVTLQVRRGEAFGIIGGNGAGKSTLLKLLSGIMRPTSGTIRVTGRLSALIEVSAGFHGDLTGRENVYLNGTILGMKRDEIRRRFDEIVAFSGLEEFIDTPVKRYSSGMYARLGFSVAAHVDPEVLLVDEVLSVGDYLFQQKCLERMSQVIADGVTVVFISHNLRAVANLCHRSVLLNHGVASEPGPTGEVLRKYLGQGKVERTPGRETDLEIVSVNTLRDGKPSVEFKSGDRMRIAVVARGRRRQGDMSIVIRIVDDQGYPLFDTCSQRLGAGPLALDAGEEVTCTFELHLTLAEGTFHVDAFLHRYLSDQPLDRWTTAATFFVAGSTAIRGVVDLHPHLAHLDFSDGAGGRRALAPPAASAGAIEPAG